MDFVNKTLAQFIELFKSLTPAARVMASLLAVLVVISLAYLFQSQTSAPDAYLMGGEPFAAGQLPAMEAAFSKANLNGYVIEGNRVRVPQGQQAAYMGALAEAGALPASFGAYLGKAVSQNNPWISKDQQRELIKVAKQNELQDIIAAMKGIERASVLYDVQEQRSFGAPTVITASVSVKPAGVLPLDEERVPTLRHLVAGAIAGLKPESVTIIDLNGKHYPGGAGGAGMSGMGSGENVYGNWKKAYEQEWQNKIRYALAYIPGVVVTPNVELDVETAHEESVTTYDPKPVAYSIKESSSTKLIKSGAPGGRPGVNGMQGTQANQPASISQASGPETNEETSDTQTNTAVPGKVVRTVQHGLTPKRVTVSVNVPSTYYERVWAERNPTLDGQPPKKPDAQAISDIETKVKADIEGAVVALLPPVPAPATDPYPRVKVSTFQPVLAATIPGPTMADKSLAWFSQYWTTLGMIGVAAASLLMLRSMIRALPSSAAAAPQTAADGGPTLSLVAGDEPIPASGEVNSARNRLKRRDGAGPSLRDELMEIVKEDPDTAVAILRNWIGAAG